MNFCKILCSKKIQTEPSKTDFAQPKPTVNFEKWVASLSPAQQNTLLSTLLKQTQSKKKYAIQFKGFFFFIIKVIYFLYY